MEVSLAHVHAWQIEKYHHYVLYTKVYNVYLAIYSLEPIALNSKFHKSYIGTTYIVSLG